MKLVRFSVLALAGLAALGASPGPEPAPSPVASVRSGLAIPELGARTGRQVYEAECAQCHGEKGDGMGLAKQHLPVRPRDFTKKRFKLRSTAPGALPSRADLFETVTRGIKRSGMPAFDFLPEGERKAVIEQVLALAGAEGKPDPAPVALPAEPEATPEHIEAGKAEYERVQCGKCHQPNEENQPRPEMKDELGGTVLAPHLLLDEFLGPDNARDLALRLRTGMDGAPMPTFGGMVPDEKLWEMALWIKSVRQPKDPLAALALRDDPVERGRVLVERHRCQGCHEIGGSGGKVGPSLDTSGAKLRVEWIRAWLANPRGHGKLFPDRYFRMPDLHLSRQDVEDLTWFVMSRGERKPKNPQPYVRQATEADLKTGEFLYRNLCTRCHALGAVVPPSVSQPVGPDLIRMAERLYYPWLELAIVSEGTTREQAVQIRDWLWKVCVEKGPKPPAPLPPR